MVKKGTRTKITDRMEEIICTEALKVDSTKGRVSRTVVAERINEVFRKLRLREPQVEVLERKISKYRNSYKAGPLEKPWQMGSLENYPLPVELIPVVMECAYRDKINKGEVFTIREAIWVTRVYPLVRQIARSRGIDEDIFDIKPISVDYDPRKNPLYFTGQIARYYARHQAYCEYSGEKLDTTDLDKDFFLDQTFRGFTKYAESYRFDLSDDYDAYYDDFPGT